MDSLMSSFAEETGSLQVSQCNVMLGYDREIVKAEQVPGRVLVRVNSICCDLYNRLWKLFPTVRGPLSWLKYMVKNHF